MARPSAVAIIETPRTYVVERRPNWRGQLAYAGKIQLFGGHAEHGTDEEPCEILRRELDQEIGLDVGEQPHLIQTWQGLTTENRRGEKVPRDVSLFHVAIASAAELTMKIPGEMVEIGKTMAEIAAYEDELTSFASYVLRAAVIYNALSSAFSI